MDRPQLGEGITRSSLATLFETEEECGFVSSSPVCVFKYSGVFGRGD